MRSQGGAVLILVRHGETEANRVGRYLGRADLELTARGRTQVEALAHLLPEPDAVVSSPLLRARQTAELLAGTVEIDERWIELDYGPLDLAPVDSVSPELADRWERDPDFAPRGVETLSALWRRVHEACDDLLPRVETSVVVVVTHVGPIKAALGWAIGAPPTLAERLFVEDAGVSRIDVERDRRVVRWFNRFGHEPGEGVEESSGRIPPGR
jgi:broad specificity phosphatase PhoE